MIHEVPLIALDDVRKPINWMFMVTLLLSVVYVASIISRIVNNAKKAQRKKAAAARNVEQVSAASKQNRYDQLMSSVEHPKQQARPAKKTLTSSRDRDRDPRR